MKKMAMFLGITMMLAFFPVSLSSQQDELTARCAGCFMSPYITTGQAMKAFLTGDEVAEFHTSLYAGNIYRIAACSQEAGNIIFSVYDKNRRLLFDSKKTVNAEYWDFKVEGSLECIIEARLNEQKLHSGVVLVMIGFKSLLN
ncbi:hypothetical protein [Breznakibacter xylanolyticus]|nr:hypothetical protein [Breznakibacter xylanolyticus]